MATFRHGAPVQRLASDNVVLLKEAVLKADVLYAIRPELYIVATPCVTADHRALVELTRGRRVLAAFDVEIWGEAR
jgi:hypothetical protein